MKKLLSVFICLALAIQMMACGKAVSVEEKTTSDAKESISATSDTSISEETNISTEITESTEDTGEAVDDENIDEESDEKNDPSEDDASENEDTALQAFKDSIYYETVCAIAALDDYEVKGCSLAFIDEDDEAELIVTADYYGQCVLIYTIKNGEVVPYNVGEEWFTMEDPLGSGVNNLIDGGHGNGYQTKDLYYLPSQGKLYYRYWEDDNGEEVTEESVFDGTKWLNASEAGYDSSANWTLINYGIYEIEWK